MSDQELKVKITAEADGIKTGSEQGAAAFAQACDKIKDSTTGLNDVIGKLGGLLAGVLSVGAMKSAIDAATSYNASIISLSRVMGVTTEQASVLSTAIKIIGGTTEEYAAMNMRLGMHIKSNADALQQLGVVLKDGNGHLLGQQEIFENTIKTMGEYKEGADRNQFALYAFGRGAAEVYKYLNLNQDMMKRATEIAERYGLVIGGDAAQQTKQMSYQLNILGIIFDAVKVQIGNEMLPTIVSLAGALGELAGTTMPYIMGAVKAFMTVFEGLRLSVQIAGTVILGTLYAIGDIVASVAKAVMLVVKGDFSGAWGALKGGVSNAKTDVKAMMESIVTDAEKSAKRLEQIWMPGKAPAASTAGPGKGTKSFTEPDKAKEDASSDMAKWRDELEQKKMDQKAYFDFSIDEERAFWESKKALATKNNNDLFQINHQLFELDKREVQQGIRDEETRIASANKLAEEAAAAKQREIDTKFRLGEISAKEQIRQEQEVQNNLFEIQTQNFSELEALAEKYPAIWQKVHEQVEANTQKHNEKITALNDKLSIETKKTFDTLLSPIQSAISTSIQGMILGTTTLQQAVNRLGQSILASFVDLGVKSLKDWTSTQLAKLNVSEMVSQALVALGITTAAEEEAIEVEEDAVQSVANVGRATSNAAVAATSAASFAGPAAPAVAAAVFASMAPFIAMASFGQGGWVPKDMMANVHAGEMVLPPDFAAGLSNLIAGGSGGRGSGDTYHVTALDSKSFMSREGRKVLKGLKGSARSLGIRM